MSMNFKADPGGNKGIVQINGVDKLSVNADGSIVALDPVVSGDTTAGRLLQVGDFGVGQLQYVGAVDLDDYTDTGAYVVSATATNMPSDYGSSASGTLEVFQALSSPLRSFQRLTNYINGQIWIRPMSSTGWLDWIQLYHRKNIVGNIGQSEGVPTGAIIERGSNANGEYVRFADGTLMCTRAITTADLSARSITNANSAGGYRSGESTLTLASPFVVAPVPSINISNNSYGIGIRGQATTNSVSVALWAINSAPSPPTTYGISIVVIGRWF